MIKIIPAIDLIGGECVRLSQGDYNQKKTYAKDPLEMAKRFEGIGIRRLHLVDLDGAKSSHPVNLKVLERIATFTSLEVEFGGGIKDSDAMHSVMDAGATYAICGSIAVTAPEVMDGFIARYGASKIILGADVKDGKIATHGWLKESAITADELIEKFAAKGIRQVICTNIAKDGMLQGPDTQMYVGLQEKFHETDIIVSGGISCAEDIRDLDSKGLHGVIVGKAIYEGRITFDELCSLKG